MTKIILLSGAPGTGKTTLSKMLHEKLSGSVYLELSWLRCYHLDKTWSNASPEEEEMSFENLVFILNNYVKHQYPYIIVNDLEEKRVLEFQSHFPQAEVFIFSLFIQDDRELKSRVLNETRDSGYRNYKAAIEWNNSLKNRDTLYGEVKIDNSTSDPEESMNAILTRIK